jgi:hypothetical protein
MFDWEWEIFDRFINEGNFEILKSSHLALPIKSFCVKRDKNLDIMIDTVCEPNVKSKIIPYPVGSVFKSENTIQFKSGDLLVTAIGGELLKWHSSMDTKNNTHHQNESASIHKIKCAIKEESQSKYVIEWLANIDDSHHIWPGITNEKINTVHSRQLQINEKTFSITGKRSLSGGSKNCLNVSIDGIDLYLSTCENLIFEKSKKPGFIVYDGFPSEEARRKIRECIAFVLGFPLVYLGHTVFNTNWQLVSFEAISPHNDMDGKAFNLAGAFPIAPLSKRLIGNSKTPNLIDYQIVSDMVNAIYSKYDEYQLRHFFWLYWHAACAPNPIQAVSFGAALEAYVINSTVYPSPPAVLFAWINRRFY